MSAGRLTAGGPLYYALAPDSNVGGEVYERMLLERLPAHGIDLVLGLPRTAALLEPRTGWQLDVLRHGRGLHWTAAPIAFTPHAMRLVRGGRVDLLRGHSVRYAGPSLLLARALARSRVPVVLHQHHLTLRWRWLEAAIASRADAVITVSEHSRLQLIEAGVPAERVHVVAPGVAGPPPAGGWREAWPQGEPRLLCLGRLEPRKRPWVAVDALAALRRAGIAASLVIAGEGPLGPELAQRAAALGVANATRFVGRVSEEGKWRLYDSAELLLFPRRSRGSGSSSPRPSRGASPSMAAAGTATVEAFEPGVQRTARRARRRGVRRPRCEMLADAGAASCDVVARARSSLGALTGTLCRRVADDLPCGEASPGADGWLASAAPRRR